MCTGTGTSASFRCGERIRVNGQMPADELVMGLTEKECRSALLMLARATTSLAGDDSDDDDGLNFTQAAITEDATRTAIHQVLMQTRGLQAATPGLEVHTRRLRPVGSASPRGSPTRWTSPRLPHVRKHVVSCLLGAYYLRRARMAAGAEPGRYAIKTLLAAGEQPFADLDDDELDSLGQGDRQGPAGRPGLGVRRRHPARRSPAPQGHAPGQADLYRRIRRPDHCRCHPRERS